jgi:hypothetical protein
LLLLEAVMETPGLVERLLEVLRPGHAEKKSAQRRSAVENGRARKENGQ